MFARREKRKAAADSKRRARKAARPDGPGDLSFFMHLRNPGSAGAAAAEEPEPTDSGDDDSTDSSAGTASITNGGTHEQPEVRLCCRPLPVFVCSHAILLRHECSSRRSMISTYSNIAFNAN